MTPYDPTNWMLLTTDTYFTIENILKSPCPMKKTSLAMGCNLKAEAHSMGSCAHQSRMEWERTFPAQGSGKAQLEDDTDLWIRGRIWAA